MGGEPGGRVARHETCALVLLVQALGRGNNFAGSRSRGILFSWFQILGGKRLREKHLSGV